MELGLNLKQTQTLSPQMMQAMEILQMGSQELLEYIQETLQENPVLESEERRQPEESPEDALLRRKLEVAGSPPMCRTGGTIRRTRRISAT